MEGTVVWRRARGTALAALVLGGTCACGSTEQIDTSPQSSASTATTSASTVAAEKNAVNQLQGWLADPPSGTLTYNTVQVTGGSGGGSIDMMKILSGPFDPGSGQATLTGTVETLDSGSTAQGQSSAVEYARHVYTSIPAAQQTGAGAGKLWNVAAVHTYWAAGSRYSGWWTALDAVKQVQSDGVLSLGGVTADMFSTDVDLSAVTGIPKLLLDSDPFTQAGTTRVEVDIYTAMGSGNLVRVTYKFGLPVQIDATASATSSAGYEVDLSGFGSATATATPTPTSTASPQPAPSTIASGNGDADLAALLPF
jgi:hypothetical protein